MPIISKNGSFPIGHISAHAPQVVHAHTALSLMAKSNKLKSVLPSAKAPKCSLITNRLLISKAEGESSLPVI